MGQKAKYSPGVDVFIADFMTDQFSLESTLSISTPIRSLLSNIGKAGEDGMCGLPINVTLTHAVN
jgi:hypothetical protein